MARSESTPQIRIWEPCAMATEGGWLNALVPAYYDVTRVVSHGEYQQCLREVHPLPIHYIISFGVLFGGLHNSIGGIRSVDPSQRAGLGSERVGAVNAYEIQSFNSAMRTVKALALQHVRTKPDFSGGDEPIHGPWQIFSVSLSGVSRS